MEKTVQQIEEPVQKEEVGAALRLYWVGDPVFALMLCCLICVLNIASELEKKNPKDVHISNASSFTGQRMPG